MYKLILVAANLISVTIAYDGNERCPVAMEWRLRAKSNCSKIDSYVCLHSISTNSFKESCHRRVNATMGGKLVWNPEMDFEGCKSERYQPIKFETDGNSDCIFVKSECGEDGQTIVSNGSSINDTTCRCDYRRGFTFITKPKNICFCIPTEEDCSCYVPNCEKLSQDYECMQNSSLQHNFRCSELTTPLFAENSNGTKITTRNDATEKSERSIQRFLFIISVLFLICIIFGSIIIAIRLNDSKEKYNRAEVPKDDMKKYINDAIAQDKSAEDHFVRVIIIGKFGVGKTSLLRRLLWTDKKDIVNIPSTDGVEINHCKINIQTGTWCRPDMHDERTASLYKLLCKGQITEKPESSNPLSESISVDGGVENDLSEQVDSSFPGEILDSQSFQINNNGQTVVQPTLLSDAKLFGTATNRINSTNGHDLQVEHSERLPLNNTNYENEHVAAQEKSEEHKYTDFEFTTNDISPTPINTLSSSFSDSDTVKQHIDSLSNLVNNSNIANKDVETDGITESNENDSTSKAEDMCIETMHKTDPCKIKNSTTLNQTVEIIDEEKNREVIYEKKIGDIIEKDKNGEIIDEEKIEEIKYEKEIEEITDKLVETLCQHGTKETSQEGEFASCQFYDFAGQRDYYATHQAFLSSCAIFLLVADNIGPMGNIEPIWEDLDTCAEYVSFWFDTIHCYWSKKGDTENRLDPPVIVVCTKHEGDDKEKKDILRLKNLLLTYGEMVVRNIFDQEFHPDVLGREVRRVFQRLGPRFRKYSKVIYPRDGKPKSSDFDIPLMVALLNEVRYNVIRGDLLPHPKSVGMEDNIQRLLYFSLQIQNFKLRTCTCQELKVHWNTVFEAIYRLANKEIRDEMEKNEELKDMVN